jgi:DNA-binding NtrC family response regulator
MANILLVDDDPAILDVCGFLLRSNNYQVSCALEGQEALRLAESQQFDVIVSDLLMPGIAGIDFLQRVRTFDPHVGFIILTGHPCVTSAVSSLKSMADDYVEKPVDDPEIFCSMIKKLLEKVLARRMPKEQDCLLSGNSHNAGWIKDLWANIHPMNFSDFVQEGKNVGRGYIPVLMNFVRKKMASWPSLDCMLILKKNDRYVIFDSSIRSEEIVGQEVRRNLDMNLLQKCKQDGEIFLVEDTPEEAMGFCDNKRRPMRTIYLPFAVSRLQCYLLFQCSPKTSVDIRLLSFLTEIVSFSQWLIVFKGNKLDKNANAGTAFGLKEKKSPDESNEAQSFLGFLGGSPKMREVYTYIKKVAPTNSTVLITGETGTGKELTARMMHALSRRVRGPFIAVNCGAIAPSLFESELFGYEKGAFTGADKMKMGLLEAANCGTIFFDEIGEITPEIQVKLLRVLQEKEVRRVGSNHCINLDVRIIASTNKNLEDEISANKFREDLFYRLNVLVIHMPPLRERGDDVRMLAERFLAKIGSECNKNNLTLSPAAWKTALEYPWPGNVRELINIMERAAILTDDDIIAQLPLGGQLGSTKFKIRYILKNKSYREAKQYWTEQFEREFFVEKINENGGNVAATARAIGLDVKSVWRKVRLYGIVP